MTDSSRRIVGIIPAAGQGSRIAPLPASKELFPIGFGERMHEGTARLYPKVISQYLLDQMLRAQAQQIYFVISPGKWDILAYYGSGKRFGANIAYLVVDALIGMPYSIDTAYPFYRGATVLFGMPDTFFSPANVFQVLLEHHEATGADLTLGLFPTDQPWRMSMVEYDDDFRMRVCFDKPAQSTLKYTWGNACWGARFSELLHNELKQMLQAGVQSEIVLADFFNKAVEQGLDVRVVPFEQGEYIDIGTPDDLAKTVRRFANHLDAQ